MKRYVLGVDGGGTKTHCALYDTQENNIDILEWGTTNHEVLKGGYNELESELGKIIKEILHRNNARIDDVQKCVFGIGGVDTKKQHEIISSIIARHGISNFILCNDAYLGIKAGIKSGYGVCAINGSGFSVAGIDPMGNMLQIGGQGEMTGDKGGGYFLVPAAIRSVYSYLYKDHEKTILKDILFDEFKISSKHDFMDCVTQKLQSDGKYYYRKISGILYEAANNGDKVSLDILKEMGETYAESIISAIKGLNFEGKDQIDIVLAGSQFVKGENSKTRDTISECLGNSLLDYKFNITLLKYPCVAGALTWALEGMEKFEDGYNCIVDKFIGSNH